MNNKEKILFVVNPAAGGNVRKDITDTISKCFTDRDHNCEYQIYTTTGENDEEQIKKEIGSYQPHKIGVAGGDGTLRMVAEIINNDIPIAIIPSGSANGMATELGLPQSVEECIDVLLNGKPTPVDCIRINDKELCLHLSDVGMNAQLIKYYQDNNWRGKLGYLRGAIKVVSQRKEMKINLLHHGEKVCRKAYMVALANARMYGTKVVINPDGSVFDGKFEVVIIKKISVFQVIKMFFGIDANDIDVFEIFSTDAVDIEVEKGIHFQVDGEYHGKKDFIKAVIEKGRLKIMLPES